MVTGVVISNLLYVIGAAAVASVGALVVVLRHRKPRSVEANVASFHRGLRALAPDQPASGEHPGPDWGVARQRRPATMPGATPRRRQADDPDPGVGQDHPVEPAEVAKTDPGEAAGASKVPTGEADTG